MCVWLGSDVCYRDQESVLWEETFENAKLRSQARARNKNSLRYTTSKAHFRDIRVSKAAEERGGVTPYNILPISASNSVTSAGAYGHGAGTPLRVADWWTRYICPSGGTILDMFAGSGTMGIAAMQNKCKFIGIEKMAKYAELAHRRIGEAESNHRLQLSMEL